MEGVSGTFFCVVLAEPFAEAVGLNTHDGIGILIKRVLPVEDIHRDGILFNLVGFAREGFLAKV